MFTEYLIHLPINGKREIEARCKHVLYILQKVNILYVARDKSLMLLNIVDMT